jgi:hypothetical protein
VFHSQLDRKAALAAKSICRQVRHLVTILLFFKWLHVFLCNAKFTKYLVHQRTISNLLQTLLVRKFTTGTLIITQTAINLHPGGGYIIPRCILLIDHGAVDAKEYSITQLLWNGQELYVYYSHMGSLGYLLPKTHLSSHTVQHNKTRLSRRISNIYGNPSCNWEIECLKEASRAPPRVIPMHFPESMIHLIENLSFLFVDRVVG